jgi:DNA-binding SARP family transcriptional activator
MWRADSGLVRARLLAELDGAPPRLTTVVAPAGCGKTTLLAHYGAAFPGPVAWLRLEPADAALPNLVRHVADTLGVARSGDPREAARALPAGALLLVDDLHVLHGSAAETYLECFVADAGIQTVIASRTLPGINLSRHELGEVRLLDQEALRFRTWEVERLFRDVYAEPLLPEDVATLTRRLGGWAAGLHMFHLSTRGRSSGERGAAVRALDGRSPQSQAYLARTVLADLPDGVRDFMVRTCVFGVLTADRCDRLLGTADARHHLRALAARQAFTDSPDHGRTFRYHEALRAHLDVELVDDLGEQGARDWQQRAAELLEADGAYADAAQAYARAANWPAVRRLLPHVEIAEPWQDLLPGWLVAEEPLLLLAQGRYLFGQGRVEAAVRAFRQAEQRARHPAAQAECRRARAVAAIWLPRAQGAHHWSAPLRAALRAHPGEVTGARPVVALAVALLAGDLATVRRLIAVETGEPLDDLASRLVRAALHAAGGADVGLDVERIADDAERAQLPWLSRLARIVPALRGGERERKEARRIAEECDRDGDAWGALLAACAGSLAGVLHGVPDPAGLDAVARRAGALGAEVIAGWAQVFSGSQVVKGIPAQGLEAARAWLRARTPGKAGAVVRCFGGFAVEVDGRAMDLSAVRPKARTLLRLLALNAGRPVHRDALLAALWPETGTSAATRSLHVALSSLRSLFAGHRLAHAIVRRGDAYVLDLRCDVAEFRRLLRGPQTVASMTAALTAYAGELLPEDGAAEWVAHEREMLRAQAVACAGALAQQRLAAGDAAGAAQAAARCLEIDEWHDPAWRALMTAYDRLGDVMSAARTRRRYAAILTALDLPSDRGTPIG